MIDVNEPTKVESIELSETEKTLTVGDEFELSSTVFPDNAYNKDLSWSSENDEIATVNNGTIKAVNPGECNIVCKSTDGSDISAQCHIIVVEP